VSGGRAEWGAGEASTRLELEAYGVPYVEKRAMWEEAVREVARMLTLEPYPGYEGKYFSFPVRNVVPKPIQKPHPPLWMACTNRASLRHAARNGIGALTFAFMDAREARFWVQDYYETFRSECVPLGRAVNPNVAMLTQFMCHPDGETARARGLEGARFFAFALSHYYRTGTHVPGRMNLWEEFRKRPPFAMAGNLGIGTPQEIREHFQAFEEAGVDQLILLHQAGNYRHEDICQSLELFGAEVLPAFKARDELSARRKAVAIEADVERALARVPPLEEIGEVRPVECYQVVTERLGANPAQLQQDRAPLPATFWRLHVGGPKGRTGSGA
jgi:alkanesulfonate monooxygenase SsuD/methylene tetrahydromethanopterin reductase-like flavin-dependent oxidoreductase (luciferase family)